MGMQCLDVLANASGIDGMAGGQHIDLASEGKQISLADLEQMHLLKTGALIKASVLLGAIAAGCQDDNQLHHLGQFSDAIGLAFQIQDDILDSTMPTEQLGKTQGSDEQKNKPTYVTILGLTDQGNTYLNNVIALLITCKV